jgi:hypothetical protein
MPDSGKLFTRNFFQIIKVLNYMSKPTGTGIEELCRQLHLNRRSIFRLLKTIECNLQIPVTVNREVFGGTASYRLSSGFVEKLSGAGLPALSLTFNQALMVYLILKDHSFPEFDEVARDIEGLREKLKIIFDL